MGGRSAIGDAEVDAVEAEEDDHRQQRGALVAVGEGMVARQPPRVRGREFGQLDGLSVSPLVACPIEGGVQCGGIAQSRKAAVGCDLIGVDRLDCRARYLPHMSAPRTFGFRTVLLPAVAAGVVTLLGACATARPVTPAAPAQAEFWSSLEALCGMAFEGVVVEDTTGNPDFATTQEFHADAHTAELLPAAATNVWTVEIVPGSFSAYALRREGTDRRFRVEFDLTRRVTPPPAPWGRDRDNSGQLGTTGVNRGQLGTTGDRGTQ